MKKIIFTLLTGIFLLVSCQEKQNPEEQLKSLNGYWQIEKVNVSKDSVINYQINPIVDYFEMDGHKGYRKKVRPKLDGTYTASEDSEKIEAKIENDSLRLYYSTPYDKWKETVLHAGNDKLSLKNEEGKIYHYNRFTPLLSDEGKNDEDGKKK